jgi:hypothetical protein
MLGDIAAHVSRSHNKGQDLSDAQLAQIGFVRCGHPGCRRAFRGRGMAWHMNKVHNGVWPEARRQMPAGGLGEHSGRRHLPRGDNHAAK